MLYSKMELDFPFLPVFHHIHLKKKRLLYCQIILCCDVTDMCMYVPIAMCQHYEFPIPVGYSIYAHTMQMKTRVQL